MRAPAINGEAQAVSASVPVPAATARPGRIQTVDALRGAIIIVIAIDRVRDFISSAATSFSPTDLSRTTTAIFLTRWITHFCAVALSLAFLLLRAMNIYGDPNRWSVQSSILLGFLRYGWTHFLLLPPPSMGSMRDKFPPGYGYELWLVYLVWIAVIVMLCPLCRWFAGLKQRRRDWWLSYL